MMFLTVVTIICLLRPVVAETPVDKVTCVDWQNKTVGNGEEYYPKVNDPCHMCVCSEGQQTMCKDVSCQPPSCPSWKQVTGKCCKFECLDGNITGVTDGNPTQTSTMTDLGLRLVASTVTTFLILALLLFLIHRFRQRRLLIALRRYSRRREVLDDSDYSPEFYGIQCPPYEDPPPPYTPPKPAPGEAPPPYDAIDSNENGVQNGGIIDGNLNFNGGRFGQNRNTPANVNCVVGHNSASDSSSGNNNGSNHGNGQNSGRSRRTSVNSRDVNRCSAINGVININENGMFENMRRTSMNSRNDGEFITSSPSRSSCASNGSVADGTSVEINRVQNNGNGSDRNLAAVHFRNSSCGGHPCITMGIQNKNRNYRNRFSDTSLSNHTSPVRQNMDHNRGLMITDNARALNLELRNTVLNLRSRNLQNTQNRNSSVNPGELSSSTTDIGESTTSAESLTSSPESPNYETDNVVSAQSSNNTHVKSEDADATVQRFLDRHFGGPASNGRRYPTTMSQSWTSPQNSSSAQNFKQSISLTTFPATTDMSQPSSHVDRLKLQQHLPRSKSEHLKTNGSLINQPFNGVVKGPKSQLPQLGRAVRVAYKDADEINERTAVKTSRQKIQNENRNIGSTSSLDRTMDTDTCDNASICTNVSNLAASILDPGEIIVTKRQDELRRLRLSHLMDQPLCDFEGENQSGLININLRPLHRSLSANSVDSSNVSARSETGDNSLAGAALSNDAKYPTNSYKHFLQTCSTARPEPVGENKQSSVPSNVTENRNKLVKQGSANSEAGMSSASSQGSRSTHSTPRKGPSRIDPRARLGENAMIRSWHAGVIESCDENMSASNMNTLVRNSNGNFEKKLLGDKDVSNVFLPHFKPSNVEVDCGIDRSCVPSSEMRACASQLYNYETEECNSQNKKDKRKPLFKRHSTGCFPTKHDHPMCRSANPGKVKISQERQLLQRADDNMKDKRRTSSRERKSNRRQTVAHERENSPKVRESGLKVTDLTPPYLMHSAIPKDFALLDHGLSGLINTNINNKQGQGQSVKPEKRSRSLGRGEAVSHSTKRSSRDGSAGSSGRKKKTHPRQSSSFHTELEHVLERQKSSAKSSPSKHCRHSYNELDRNNCAITQV